LVLAAGSGEDKSESKKTPTVPTATPPPAAKAPTADEWWATRSQEIATLLKEAADARKKGDVAAIQPKLADSLDQLQKERQRYPMLDTQIGDAVSRLTVEQKATDKVRLAARKFSGVTADGLVNAMLFNSNHEELWETTYQGKYVRWQGKFLEKDRGILSYFKANVGESSVVSCKSLDSSQSPDALDNIQRWQGIKIEGSLVTFEKKAGEDRAMVKLEECIVRTP
jgi:hypothetical protein